VNKAKLNMGLEKIVFHESGVVKNVKFILKAWPKSFGRWATKKKKNILNHFIP